MSDELEISATNDVPEDFCALVKQTLEHLYDLPYLQRHPLAQQLFWGMETTPPHAGQQLRQALLTAIESLSSGAGVPFRAPHARPYNLLYLHYVEGLTIQEAAHELGVSLRQAYRDLRRGEEGVAAALWATRAARQAPAPRARDLSSVQAEISRLEPHPRPIDVRPILQRAQNAVGRLAQQRGVIFQAELPAEPVVVSADPTMAQQVLVSILSYAVQQAQPGALRLTLTVSQGQTFLSLRYIPDPQAASAPVASVVASQLADRLGWVMQEKDEPGGQRMIAWQMAMRGPTVLVIDDNEGLVELLNRYLTGHACRVVAAASGREGLELAEAIRPDAIVLDVMMPEMDGWEVLQTLHTRPQTAATPVIVCSVFNDPELAYSLGASLFLPKPVRRDDVLTALRQLNVI